MNTKRIFLPVLALLLAAGLLNAQVIVTGSLSGTVSDQTGAVVPGAKIRIVSEETGATYNLTANEAGVYFQAALNAGFYRLEVTSPGFRQSVLHKIKVDVGTPATADVKLEVGATTESVQVQAEATAVVTATSTIGTTVTGRQIIELPFTSRDALDLALLVPGHTGGGNPRSSSFNALPKSAINITMDGLNTMDNLLKSGYGGGFFTFVRPRIDAIEEFTISTAAAGAEAAGEGAVQIRFATRRGTNDWHGGGYWYVRNDYLNSNYYFNNLNGLPRQAMKLNQYGGKVGGPIFRNRLFFFANMEEWRLPGSTLRTRTVLRTEGLSGVFRYKATDGAERTGNVLDVARAAGHPSTVDPTIGDLLRKIDALRTGGLVGITPNNLFTDSMSFNNPDKGLRRFPTLRMDWNVSDRIQWEMVWNYNYFDSFPDVLNGRDRPFPGFETIGSYQTQGEQSSNRFSWVTALRWMVTSRINNELRFGLMGGTTTFAMRINPDALPNGRRVSFPLVQSVIDRNPSQRRNTPLKQISDNLYWAKQAHTVALGFNATLLQGWSREMGGLWPLVSLGVGGTDPISSVISATSMPGISTNDLSNAWALYALLTGRVSGVSGSVYVDENQKKFAPLKPLIRREVQREVGLYVTDTWRYRPSLTLNYGLRWEYQGAPWDRNGIYTSPGYAGVWGVSGVGNLFAPGTLKGAPTMYVADGKPRFFDPPLNNFAPNLGFSWSPASEHGVLKAIFGQGGAFRAGYGISFVREGMNVYRSMAGANPGPTATATLTRDVDFKAGTLLLRDPLPELKLFPSAYTFPLPLSTFTYRGSGGPNWPDPGLRTPYVQSWSAGIQRELFKDTVLEVRYVGNHGTKLWRQFNLNEVNIVENGFLAEFQRAAGNLSICTANRVACTGSASGALRFDNRGLPGQVNLPIFSAAFAGLGVSSGFSNGTFVTNLQQGTAGTMAGTLSASGTYMPNIIKGGYPQNFFLVNPEAASLGAYTLRNGADSSYHSVQFEVRRRFSRGLLFNANYTFSKGLSDYFADSDSAYAGYVTQRNGRLNRMLSPYDITHQFKVNWIYELPFGHGKRWDPSSGVLDRIVGGWQFQGIARLQSGRPFQLTSGRATFNGSDAGVISTLTRQQLESNIGVWKTPDRKVYWFNPALIGADGRADPKSLREPVNPGEFGNTSLILHGPKFVRFDMTAAKRTRIWERLDVELRAEVLNAFNTTNFLVGSASAANNSTGILSTTFGRTTAAYQDISTTNDPGGRIVQLVLRINF